MGKLKGVYAVLTIAAFFVACTAPRQATESLSMAIPFPPKEYTPAEAATFNYLQGVRMEQIHGEPLAAAVCYWSAIEQDSLHAPSWYGLANALTKSFPDSALLCSYRANRLDTANIWYKLQLGRLLIGHQQYDSALKVYHDIVRLAPHNPENYKYLAALYEQTRQPFTAIMLLDSAEVKFGIIEELATYKRRLLIETGLIDRAVSETQALIRNFPYDERNYIILGELYARGGKDSLALDAYTQALTIAPENVDALAALNEFHRQRNNLPEFFATTKKLFASDQLDAESKLKYFDDVIKTPQFYQQRYFDVNELVGILVLKYPKDYEVTRLLAQHQINSGHVEGALTTYKTSLEDSARLETFNAVLDIESYLNHPDSVMRYSELAVRTFPKNPELYMRRGYAYYNLKDYKKAEKAMREALKYAETDSLKSVIYTGIGDMIHSYDSARTKRYYPLYEKALAYDPVNIFALNNYSYYLSLEGKRLDEALKMIERVLEIEPGNPTYIDTYGWILYKMERYEDAKKAMRQAVSLDGAASKELLLHYGDILYELKEYFMASVYWKKALEKGYDPREIEKRMKLIEGK